MNPPTSARSSSDEFANDFDRKTSTALATMPIAVSSPGSGLSSPSSSPCHSIAVVPARTSRSSGWSPQSTPGRASDGRSSSIVAPRAPPPAGATVPVLERVVVGGDVLLATDHRDAAGPVERGPVGQAERHHSSEEREDPARPHREPTSAQPAPERDEGRERLGPGGTRLSHRGRRPPRRAAAPRAPGPRDPSRRRRGCRGPSRD